MRTRSPNRPGVSARAISLVVAGVAAKHRLTPAQVRNMRCRDLKVVAARHEAWRLLAADERSVNSIAKGWPCSHTPIYDALDKVVK